MQRTFFSVFQLTIIHIKMKHHLLKSLTLLNLFLWGNDCMLTLIKNSPVIFKALASTTTTTDSLILEASLIYKGKPKGDFDNNNVLKG